MYVGEAKYFHCKYFAYMCWHEDRNNNETPTFMDGGRGNAIESQVEVWLNGLSGEIVVPLAIALGSLLYKDGS